MQITSIELIGNHCEGNNDEFLHAPLLCYSQAIMASYREKTNSRQCFSRRCKGNFVHQLRQESLNYLLDGENRPALSCPGQSWSKLPMEHVRLRMMLIPGLARTRRDDNF